MIERIKYKNRLTDLFRKVKFENKCQIAVITGAEKIGKTQLLKSTFPTFNQGVFETTFFKDDPSKLAPIVQFLRQFIQKEGKEWLSLNPASKFLAGILPELGEFHNQSDSQSQVLAVSEAIKYYSSKFSLVWIIDNGQWMDKETANFLSQLIRGIEGCPVFIILSSLKIELLDLPINQLLTDLHYHPNYLEMEILPFNSAEIIQLGKEGFSFSISENLSENLLNFTGGNPFFLNEIYKNFPVDQYQFSNFNIEELVEDGSLKIPKNIIQTIGISLNKEKPESANLIKIAALFGFQFEMELLESVYEDYSSIDNLLKFNWIILLEQNEDWATFQNKLIFYAIKQTISWSEKKWMAEKIASFLDRKNNDNHAELSGDFWNIAGNKENARKAYILASSHHCKLKNYKAAVTCGQSALSLWPLNLETKLKAEVLINLAECA
ncbi:MAG: AAA family ATPase, partial [Flammeovirgaceae bacterium]|nr:AAA family ATPase [Flammeovirgaceae bacterium]